MTRSATIVVAGCIWLSGFGSATLGWAQEGGGEAAPAAGPADIPSDIPGGIGPPGGDTGGPAGYSGSDNVMEGGDPALMGRAGAMQAGRHRGSIPKYHNVRQGDTLWNLCDYYYGDPWIWPRLWAYNKSVTNPHWIYPGDRVRLLAGQTLPNVSPDTVEIVRGPSQTFDRGPLALRQNAFLDPKELEASAAIVGSQRESLMLAAQQEVYIKGEGQFKPERGQTYSVFRVIKKLRAGGRDLGHIVEILGEVRVKKLNAKGIATAEITDSVNPIHRGDRIGELRRVYRRLPPRPAEKNLDARLVAFFRQEAKQVGTDELVFIDQGRNQGVELGNRFLVLRRGDGYRRMVVEPLRDNPDFPHEVVAEISVLDVRDDASVGIVTQARRELNEGEHILMRRGY